MENFLLAHEMNEIVEKGKQQATEIQIVEIFSVVSSTFLYLTFYILPETKKTWHICQFLEKLMGLFMRNYIVFLWCCKGCK